MVSTTTETMKAIQIHKFGGPEVLKLDTVARPEPGPHQVLVRVYAAGVNPADWKLREGKFGEVPFPAIMGNDFSGEIEALGPDVTEFRVGESVFGSVAEESGSYAEYCLAPTSQIIEKPASLDHIQAASVPVPVMTAWQALFDEAKLRAGQKILIHAAAGGVGNFAVQFAKWKGAYVIGTASADSADLVRKLGAHEVIDYRNTRFEDVVQNADVVFDTIGGETQERSWKVLNRGGVLVSIVQPPSAETAAARGVRGIFMREDAKRNDELIQIAKLLSSGQIKINVETVLPLSEARKAQELSQSGHAHGKIVLTVAP